MEAIKRRVLLIDIANFADHHRNEEEVNPKEIRFVTACVENICLIFLKKIFLAFPSTLKITSQINLKQFVALVKAQ